MVHSSSVTECHPYFRRICYCCSYNASVMSDSVQPHRQEPPGSPIPGIVQARTLEWVAISFPNSVKWKVKMKSFSRIRLLATPWITAYQAPPSLGFSRQEDWSASPLPSPQKEQSPSNYWHIFDREMDVYLPLGNFRAQSPRPRVEDDSVFSGWGLCCPGFLPPVGAPAPTSPLSPPDQPQF